MLKSSTKLVSFCRCIFSSSELQSIFIAAKHINKLCFRICKLDVTDDFDIKEQAFNINELVLFLWGDDSGWNNNIDGLEILVKAVANSSLKVLLKRIWIEEKWKDIEYKDKVKEIFERHDLQHVLEQ